MILIFHITVAVLSIALATYISIAPTKQRLNLSYVLVALTVGTGFYLIAQKPANMTSTCIVGLLYLGYVSFSLIKARQKLLQITEGSR